MTTMKWHDRDGRWYGYDADLPGGAHLYRKDGDWRATVLVNGKAIDDVALPGLADAPIDKVLAAAADAAADALARRSNA